MVLCEKAYFLFAVKQEGGLHKKRDLSRGARPAEKWRKKSTYRHAEARGGNLEVVVVEVE